MAVLHRRTVIRKTFDQTSQRWKSKRSMTNVQAGFCKYERCFSQVQHTNLPAHPCHTVCQPRRLRTRPCHPPLDPGQTLFIDSLRRSILVQINKDEQEPKKAESLFENSNVHLKPNRYSYRHA